MKHKNRRTELALHLIFAIIAVACLLPFLLLIIASITDETDIIKYGYSFFPHKISFGAYIYLIQDKVTIIRAYGISIFVTIVGTFFSLFLISLLAYPLSRKDIPYRKSLSFFVFFTMLFNGGLVPTYVVYTQIFGLKNTLLALIVPYLLMNGFYVLLARTFFSTSIPVPIIESSYMDGAGEFKIFYKIILPLSLPILATIGMFEMISYWNDWFNSLIFITDNKLYSLQFLLNKALLDIQFLSTSNLGTNVDQMAASIPKEGVRMAMAVIGTLPMLIAYPFFQKYFIKGLTIGAVKG
jgi:putative aldouronate transport system permease protein